MNRLKQEIQVKDSSPSLSSLSFFVPPFNAFAFWHCSKSHGAPEEVLFLQTNGFFEDQAPHLLKRLADIARLVSYTKMSVCCFLILIVDQHVRILLGHIWKVEFDQQQTGQLLWKRSGWQWSKQIDCRPSMKSIMEHPHLAMMRLFVSYFLITSAAVSMSSALNEICSWINNLAYHAYIFVVNCAYCVV